MKKFNVTISLEKYMQDQMHDEKLEEWLKNRGQIIEGRDLSADSDEAKAEFTCYRNKDGECYVPNFHIEQALINGATQVKSKVGTGKKSMVAHVAAFFEVQPEEIKVRDWDEADKRTVVNKRTGARVLKTRARWNNLKLSFILVVKNSNIVTDDMIFNKDNGIFYFAGTMFGIGNYTPQHKGKFGTFTVEKWKEIK